MIPLLPVEPVGVFPDSNEAHFEPNGLLAAGGALTKEWLLTAYRQGIFPWFGPDEPILWWTPNPRCVLFTDELHLARRFRQTLHSKPLVWTMNQCFEEVVDACAAPRATQAETWITPEMREAYVALHHAGHAHSLEVWDGELAGGVYGVAIGRMFFAESMFSAKTNGSKYALFHLCERLSQAGFTVIDCQVESPHIQRMGAREISRDQFEALLERQCALPSPSPDWWLGSD